MKFKLMTDAEVIEAAREDYAYPSSDNIEIDDEPVLSRIPGSAFANPRYVLELGEGVS